MLFPRLFRGFVVPALLAAVLFVATAVAARPAAARAAAYGFSSIVVEAASGRVLSADSPDALRHPASLTKLMTLYMTFEALRDRRVAIDQDVPVSEHCASMSPTKLGLVPGTRITVEQAILGIVTRSANDAACALGELLGGNEHRFAQMMTLRARALGMRNSVFRNASGLPDPAQFSTARDMATLTRHLIRDFPAQYHWFSTPEFVWHGQTILNHDHMLQTYPGADGLKTGYINSSGHNLVTSAVRDNVRLIGVIFGAPSNGARDQRMTALLNQGFARVAVAGATPPRPELEARRVSSPPPERVATPARSPAAEGWSIEVGAFTSEATARKVAFRARRAVADADGEPRVEKVRLRGVPLWRALVSGFSEREAERACAVLARHRMRCLPLRAEIGQLASR
jgi:D-alanyl-D-alanine carboxypeptidase